MNVHGICEFWEGCALGAVALAAHAWSDVYPIVTGLIALFSLFIAAHGACRIVWRWWNGYPNFLTDRENMHRDRSNTRC